MSKLRLESISMWFGRSKVIDELSLPVKEGELLSLVGESGCGKTTTLRLIAGLETPDSGQIFIDQRDVTSIPVGKRRTGMVFQNLALFPHLTVQENIFFGLKDRRKFKELIEKTSLVGLEDRFPHKLSGGQQQRVALARALAAETDILLLDEPFSNLDELTKDYVSGELLKVLKAEGLTTIMVSHHPADSLRMSDEVAVMQHGQIIQLGTPEQIYESPDTAYTADLFGSSIRLAAKSAFGVLPWLGSTFLIRPEHIHISRSDGPLMGKVREIYYKGRFSLLIIESQDGKETMTLEIAHPTFEIGEKIYLQPNLDKLITLTDP